MFCGDGNREISFNEEVRPILSENCMKCHGGVRQLSDFSLLFRDEALSAAKSGKHPIVPGDVDSSELLHRVKEVNASKRMPPEGPPLNKDEIWVLEKWIAQGAKWEKHWAYEKPRHEGAEEGIDAFVRAKHTEQNLAMSGQAEREVLLKRLSLDITGLPFDFHDIEDAEQKSIEELIDLLLVSQNYGEKWTSMWLDLARYGDSQGYQKDHLRSIWRYRDWVIHALNEDMPFDQFTIEQLAGDMLENPSDSQILASAFHRNTMTNDEGGTDDEEFRVVAVIDRLNTTFETWQASTLSCVQCHAHPYDPFKFEEFYKLLAYFNNTADQDLTSDFPKLTAMSPAEEKQKMEIEFLLLKEPEMADSLLGILASLGGETPVMQELPTAEARTTTIFERGNWLVPGDTVKPALPAILNDGNIGPVNRLEFAQWLVDDDNPLTARVMVNRVWEQIFGLGLVETLEDFGTLGAKPSHPELLDWLALEFSENMDWSIKTLIREIVLSKTYQQKSSVTSELLEADPRNKYLSRGPRVRLSAEQIRDYALAVSGLLSKKVYGPSVMPPQPDGVWNVIRHVAKWETSKGEDKYRRALYTLHRKSSPYPSQITFDGTSREFCVSRRIRTNTPLQALVTLNDPVYFEAAASLAERMQEESPATRIASAYRIVTGLSPDERKVGELEKFYKEAFNSYASEPALIDSLGFSPKDKDPEWAALLNTANVLLNLDEVLVKS